jgi:hypothetical protein
MAGRHALGIELLRNSARAETLAVQRLDAGDGRLGVVGTEEVRRGLRRFLRQ